MGMPSLSKVRLISSSRSYFRGKTFAGSVQTRTAISRALSPNSDSRIRGAGSL